MPIFDTFLPKRRLNVIRFQIWPQNSKRITFDPLFGQQTVENWLNIQFSPLSIIFGKKGSNVVRFEIWGQIWNSLITSHIISPPPLWYDFYVLIFFTSHACSKFSNCSRQRVFKFSKFLPDFWHQNSLVPRNITVKIQILKKLFYDTPYWVHKQ